MTFMNASPTVSAAGTSAKKMWHGIYTASVVSTQDPQKKSRVQLRIPQVLGTSTSNWAVPVGFEPVVPKVNQVVWAMFLGGDVNHPLYVFASTTNATTNVPGLPSVPVISGTTIDQSTMTNATLTSPTVNTPTITTPTVTGGTFNNGTYSSPTLSNATLNNATIDNATIDTPTITHGSISNATLTNSTINSPFNINNPTVTNGTITGSTIANATITNPSITGGTLSVSALAANSLNIGGATGTAAVEINGDAHVIGNFVTDELNGTTIPMSTVSTVQSAVVANWPTMTASQQATFLTTYASAINGLIARLQSAGLIS